MRKILGFSILGLLAYGMIKYTLYTLAICAVLSTIEYLIKRSRKQDA